MEACNIIHLEYDLISMYVWLKRDHLLRWFALFNQLLLTLVPIPPWIINWSPKPRMRRERKLTFKTRKRTNTHTRYRCLVLPFSVSMLPIIVINMLDRLDGEKLRKSDPARLRVHLSVMRKKKDSGLTIHSCYIAFFILVIFCNSHLVISLLRSPKGKVVIN